MQMKPYVSFNGQCEEAFKFYEQCLGAKIIFLTTYEGTPMVDQAPPGWSKKILHATLEVDGQILQGADSPRGKDEDPRGFSITLSMTDPLEAERIFGALAEN